MRKLQRFSAAVLLILVLSLPSNAGDIGTPGLTAPASQQSSVTGDISFPGATSTGDMSTPGAAAVDPVTEAVLGLVQGLMSLF